MKNTKDTTMKKLTRNQFIALIAIVSGAQTLAAISRKTGLAHTSTISATRALEKKGMVRRYSSGHFFARPVQDLATVTFERIAA